MPRSLTARQLAEELGMTIHEFRGALKRGEFPSPDIRGRAHRWTEGIIEARLNPMVATTQEDRALTEAKKRLGVE